MLVPSIAPALPWHALLSPLGLQARELRLASTLENGQCFGWQRQSLGDGEDATWIGVLGHRLLQLRETETDCLFRCLGSTDEVAAESAASADALREELRMYFQLATPYAPLYDAWSKADERMAAVAHALPGMRVLRQEPVECLFSFICSSNNNIGRIGGMLQALRRQYGDRIPLSPSGAELAEARPPPAPASELTEGEQLDSPGGQRAARDYFTFPSAEALAAASEEELRGLGLGYRAPYVRKTAEMLCDRGAEWLPSLRRVDDPDAVRAQLSELPGVGPKVADCVALFSLDQAGAIPVDTHVWDIACRDLDRTLSNAGSLTPRVYARVGGLFRERYGTHAGWAHSLLFAAELPQFRGRLPAAVQEEMERFRTESRAARAQEKLERQQARSAKAAAALAADERDEGDDSTTAAPTAGAAADVAVEGGARGEAASPGVASDGPRDGTSKPPKRRKRRATEVD